MDENEYTMFTLIKTWSIYIYIYIKDNSLYIEFIYINSRQSRLQNKENYQAYREYLHNDKSINSPRRHKIILNVHSSNNSVKICEVKVERTKIINL